LLKAEKEYNELFDYYEQVRGELAIFLMCPRSFRNKEVDDENEGDWGIRFSDNSSNGGGFIA